MTPNDNTKSHGRTLVILLAGLGLAGIALMWGWNTFAVDLMGQKAMHYRHAVALELLVFAVAAVFAFAGRLMAVRHTE